MQTNLNETVAPAFYTVRDIQYLMGIGRNSAYKLINESDFPSIYVGNRIIVPADLFNNWVNEQAQRKRR